MLKGVHAIRDGVPAPGSALTRRPLGYGFASWRAFLFEW